MNANNERIVEISKEKSISLKISIAAIMSALTCVFTMLISIYIPASEGFFNIGESIVYLSAILFGPYIGAITGGIGSMTADLLLGYPGYAIGTLVIKGLEGFVVGYMYQRLNLLEKSKKLYSIIFICSTILLGLVLILIFNPGELPYLDILKNLWVIEIGGDLNVWLIISLSSLFLLILLAIIFRFYFDKDTSNKIISMLTGGFFMILGYFIYGTFIMGITGAYFEIPFNLFQSIIGILIAVPTSIPIKKRLII